jgi:tetratricopeptide (TPR) repeat protein
MQVIQQARTALLFCERADELFDQDKLEQSLATFTKATEIDETCAAAWAGRGSVQNALQRWGDAMNDATRAIDLNKGDFTSLYNVSELLVSLLSHCSSAN